MNDNSNSNGNSGSGPSSGQSWDPWARHVLAFSITGVSILGVFVLAVFSIMGAKQAQSKEILATVLPVIGTWVGAVIAFYFGRENFEAANRSVERMVRSMTSSEKLAATPARACMIENNPNALFSRTEPFDQVPLKKVLEDLDKDGKGSRVPLFDANRKLIRGVVHRSLIDRFLTNQALAGKAAADLGKLTLDDLLRDTKLKGIVVNIGTVKPDATLAEVKKLMEGIRDCQDVFVTTGGGPGDEVIGWITNVIIEEKAKV